MPNIIFEEGGNLRTTQCSTNETYGIESLQFYIPLSHANSQAFLILKNSQNLYEIVELSKAKRDKNHIIYQIASGQTFRVSNDLMSLAILLLDPNKNIYEFSKEISLNLTTDKYVIARQIQLAGQLGAQVQAYYQKIVNLTEENKKIYDYMKGVH